MGIDSHGARGHGRGTLRLSIAKIAMEAEEAEEAKAPTAAHREAESRDGTPGW